MRMSDESFPPRDAGTAGSAAPGDGLALLEGGDAESIDRFLAEADKDFWLAARYAAPADAARVRALMALALELRRIPSVVSEAPIGEIRLQWWREALDELAAGSQPRGHPLLQALHAAGAVDDRTRVRIETGIDARARFLYPDPFENPRALFTAMRGAEGWLAPLLAASSEIDAGAETDAEIGEAAADLAGAYATARWGRQIAPDLAEEIAPFTFEVRREALVRLGRRGRAALRGPLAYLALANGYLARPADAPWPMMKQVALFRAVLGGRF